MTLADDVNLEEFVMSKDELSGADIKAMCTPIRDAWELSWPPLSLSRARARLPAQVSSLSFVRVTVGRHRGRPSRAAGAADEGLTRRVPQGARVCHVQKEGWCARGAVPLMGDGEARKSGRLERRDGSVSEVR